MHYITVEIKNMGKAFEAKLESAKRSILYDFNTKIEEVKTMLRVSTHAETEEMIQMREVLPTFPLKTLESFMEFEEQLSSVDSMPTALVRIIAVGFHSLLWLALIRLYIVAADIVWLERY